MYKEMKRLPLESVWSSKQFLKDLQDFIQKKKKNSDKSIAYPLGEKNRMWRPMPAIV